MNKNLKRALNTTAAVSMSLAMVLGAVAPMNTTTVNAAAEAGVTESQKINAAYGYFESLYYGLKDDITEMPYTAGTTVRFEVKDADKNDVFVGTDGSSADITQLLNVKIATGDDVWQANSTLDEMLPYVAEDGTKVEDYDQNVIDFASYLYGPAGEGFGVAVQTLKDLVASANYGKYTDEGYEFPNGNAGTAEYKVASKLLSDVNAYKKYAENAGLNVDDLEQEISYLQENVDVFKDENADNFVADYVKVLEGLEVVNGNSDTSVYYLVKRGTDIDLDRLSTLEKFIKDVKGDKITELKKIAKYDDLKDEEEVAEYIAGLEAIVEEMKEAKDLMKTTSEVYKEFKLVRSKLNALAGASKAEDIEKAIADFRAQDVEAVVNYVDEVFSKFFYVKATYRTSTGKYSLALKKADYGRYVDENDFNTPELNSLKAIMKDNTLDQKSEESKYDLLTEKSVDIEKLYKAVTEDIEGITVSSVITDKEAAKIVAAYKAMLRLNSGTGSSWVKGDLYDSLTPEEKREVRANEELVRALYMKLIYSGEVVKTGWVQNSDGSWSFLEEDGTVRQYGWVAGNGTWSFVNNGKAVYNGWCAAKEGWYYMGADGYMVSDTTMTIDGISYTFDANGLLVD